MGFTHSMPRSSAQPARFFQLASDQTFEGNNFGDPRVSWSQLAEKLRPGDTVVPWFGRVGSTGRTWHCFKWTSLHKSPTHLEPLRLIGDVTVDSALDIIGSGLVLHRGKNLLGDLVALSESDVNVVKEHDERIRILAARKLIAHFREEPKWIDWGRVRRGQDFFLQHAFPAGLVLLHLSLIGGFSAPKIDKVLTSTGYLTRAGPAAYRRVLETYQMVAHCLADRSLQVWKDEEDGKTADEPESCRKAGEGWEAVIRVRLLHALVRRRLLSSCSLHGDDQNQNRSWDKELNGIPINQEDLSATLLSFSYNVLFGLRTLGYYVSDDDAADYCHFWRVIGFYMGVAEDFNFCDSHERAKAMMESMVMHLMTPDTDSSVLALNLISSFASKPPFFWSETAHAEMCRMLLGDIWADALHMPQGSWLWRLSHRARLWWSCLMSSVLFAPPWRTQMLNWSRRTICSLVVNLLGEPHSTFALKPAFDPGATVTLEQQIAAGKDLNIFKTHDESRQGNRWTLLRHVLVLSTTAVVIMAGLRSWSICRRDTFR